MKVQKLKQYSTAFFQVNERFHGIKHNIDIID